MMTKRRKIKYAFYLVSFSVSLYTLSRVINPIMTIAAGDGVDLQGTFLQRFIPELGGDDSDTARALQALISGHDDTGRTTTSAARAKLDDFLESIEKNNGIPSDSQTNLIDNITSRTTTTTATSGVRTLRNSSRTAQKRREREATLNAIEMNPLDRRTLDPDLLAESAKSATTLHQEGKLAEAILAYRQAITREPKRVSHHKNLALAYYQTGNYRAAWKSIQAAETLGGTVALKFLKALDMKLPDPR